MIESLGPGDAPDRPRRGPAAHRDLATRLVGAAVVAFVIAAVAAPLLRMVWVIRAEGSDPITAALSRPGLTEVVTHSVVLALAVTALAVPVGTLLALLLRRPGLPAGRALRLAMLLPVLVPDFVLAYSWLRAYGETGLTDDALGLSWVGIQGPVGIAIVLTVNIVPLVYLVVVVGLAARTERLQELAAHVSGARSPAVTRTVTLPLLRPALTTAAVLVFVLSLAAFAIPQFMGAPSGFDTVTTRIYADLSRSSDPDAFVEALLLALLLVAVALAVVLPVDAWLTPRLRSRRTSSADQFRAGPAAHGRVAADRWAAAVVSGYLALAVALPLVSLVATATTRAVGLPPTPQNLTTTHFTTALTPRNLEALGRSLTLAALAATALVLLGGAVAAWESRSSGRLTGTLVTATFVLPGSTLAVGLLVTYGRWIGGTLVLIWLAYVAKLWALAHRPISGALDRLPPEELWAARASGASAITGIRTVVLRPLLPAVLAAWLLCFLTALHEVTMSILLYGPGSETLAVVVLNSAELGEVGKTAALSVLLTGLVLVPGLACWAAVGRLDRRQQLLRQRETVDV